MLRGSVLWINKGSITWLHFLSAWISPFNEVLNIIHFNAELLSLWPGERNNGLSVMIASNGDNCLWMLFSLQSGHVQTMFGIQAGLPSLFLFFCFFLIMLSKIFHMKIFHE